MRKSNIALLVLFAVGIGLLGYTKETLTKKLRSGNVRVITTNERLLPLDSLNQAKYSVGRFHHILLFGWDNSETELIAIKDSSVFGPDGQRTGLIYYRKYSLYPINPARQFRIVDDTLFMNLANVEAATIYTNGLQSVTSLEALEKRPILLQALKTDKMSLDINNRARLEMEDCSFGYLDIKVGPDGVVACDSSNKIGTLDFSLLSTGTLVLDNFKGKLNNISIDPESNLQLKGSSFETLTQQAIK